MSQISRSLDLSKAMVYRILRSLFSLRLLRIAETGRRHRLGSLAARQDTRALHDLDLRQIERSSGLQRLQTETGETATVTELVGASSRR